MDRILVLLLLASSAIAAPALKSKAKKQDVAPAAPAPAPHDPDAVLAAKAMLASARALDWTSALQHADRALALEPNWGELYYLRAGVLLGLAGPESTTAALQSVKDGVSYEALSELLSRAESDLGRYGELEPLAADHDLAWKARGEVQARARTALQNGVRQRERAEQRRIQAETEANTALGKMRVDGQHWCYPGQSWNGAQCVGVPQCPNDKAPSGTECACLAGQVLTGARCCWPGQTWMAGSYEYSSRTEQKPELALGCSGTPRCPQGFRAAHIAGPGDTCIPLAPVWERTQERECGREWGDFMNLPRAMRTQTPAWFRAYPDYRRLRCNITQGAQCEDAQLFYDSANSAGCYYVRDNVWCCP